MNFQIIHHNSRGYYHEDMDEIRLRRAWNTSMTKHMGGLTGPSRSYINSMVLRNRDIIAELSVGLR